MIHIANLGQLLYHFHEKSAPWSVCALIVGVCIHPFKKSKGKLLRYEK